MHPQKCASPAPRVSGDTGLKGVPCLAAGTSEYNTNLLLVQRLQVRFGLSQVLAATIAQLAGLGNRDGRT